MSNSEKKQSNITVGFLESLQVNYAILGKTEETFLIEVTILEKLEIPDLATVYQAIKGYRIMDKFYIRFSTLRQIIAFSRCPKEKVEQWQLTLDTLKLVEYGI